jgi:hypothetical protein
MEVSPKSCVGPLTRLVVTQSGSRSGDEPRRRPGLMPFNLALDLDLGLDPNRGSVISSGSGFLVNRSKANIYV